MIDRDHINAAYGRISDRLRQTPVVDLEPGALCDRALSLKLELFQHTGSFKTRGAFNALLSAELTEAGVVGYSGGNHGAALANAATNLGVKSTIFAPDWSGEVKIERMRYFGAKVVVCADPTAVILEKFHAFAAETGAMAVHPFDDARVLAGQGTLGLEIERDRPQLDTLMVSVGGGGLIGGITAWYQDHISIVAVETEGTASLQNAFSDDPEQEISPAGISASALGGTKIGTLSREILGRWRPVSVVVTDDDVFEAGRRLWSAARVLGEPGAATALAALTSGKYQPAPDERVGVLVCGGNADPGWFQS